MVHGPPCCYCHTRALKFVGRVGALSARSSSIFAMTAGCKQHPKPVKPPRLRVRGQREIQVDLAGTSHCHIEAVLTVSLGKTLRHLRFSMAWSIEVAPVIRVEMFFCTCRIRRQTTTSISPLITSTLISAKTKPPDAHKLDPHWRVPIPGLDAPASSQARRQLGVVPPSSPRPLPPPRPVG